ICRSDAGLGRRRQRVPGLTSHNDPEKSPMIMLNVNGQSHQLEVSPEMPLLWALRDRLNLTGTKFGCGHALCGACTVHIDGEAARSCSIMAGEAVGKSITTVEGVSGRVAEAVKKAWQQHDVVP